MPTKEVSTVVAVGAIEGDEFVPASVAYWRLLASETELVVSVAPVLTDGAERDQATTVVIPDPERAVRALVDQLGGESARVLRALYGGEAEAVEDVA